MKSPTATQAIPGLGRRFCVRDNTSGTGDVATRVTIRHTDIEKSAAKIYS